MCWYLKKTVEKDRNQEVTEKLRKDQVKKGTFQGLVGKAPRITVFRGVPYVIPPVGELRWRAPQPAEGWEGIKIAALKLSLRLFRESLPKADPGGNYQKYGHQTVNKFRGAVQRLTEKVSHTGINAPHNRDNDQKHNSHRPDFPGGYFDKGCINTPDTDKGYQGKAGMAQGKWRASDGPTRLSLHGAPCHSAHNLF